MSIKFFSILLILLLAVPVFSSSKEKEQPSEPDGQQTVAAFKHSDTLPAADKELYKILKKNITEKRYSSKITELTANLSQEQKDRIYEDHKKEPVAPFILNTVVSFGTGSLSQRDYEGFLIEFGFMIYGATSITRTIINKELFGYSNDFSYAMGISNMFIGAGFCAAGYIIGLVRPWTYSKKYNQQLKSCLFPELESTISFAPVADLQAQNYGLICKIKL